MDWKRFYEDVYDILISHAGAHVAYRDHFVSAALSDDRPMTEFRFQGHLGFGGKVWRYGGKLYVTCYGEDKTPKREQVILDTNAALLAICPPGGIHGSPKQHEAQ